MNYKDIKGRRVRALPEITKKINIIIVSVFFGIPILLIALSSDKTLGVLLLCGVIFAFGRLFLPGRVLCVLADDRIYYFKDNYRVDFAEDDGVRKKVYSADGWISYAAIRNISYETAEKKHFPTLTLTGDGFELRLRCVGASVAREIEKRRGASDYGFGERSASPEIAVSREGLWLEMWNLLEREDPSAIVGYPGAEVELEMYVEENMDTADILVRENGAEVDVSFDRYGVYVILGKDAHSISYENVTEISEVLDWISREVREKLT